MKDKPDERLRFYAERFPLVENDASYYALPSPKQAQLWADRTPDGFVMSFKAFGPMTTHPTDPKRLPKDLREALPKEAQAKKRVYPKDLPRDVQDEVFTRFWVALEPLRKAGKLGAILLQYPDWFVISRASKEEILRARERLPDDRVAVEFRNATWMSERNRDETLRFLRDHGLTYVAVDEPQGFPSSIPPVHAVTNEELAIVRFHGRNADTWKKPGLTAAERFNYRYSLTELKEWAPKIEELAREAKEVHLLMNNCYGDKAVKNAEELGALLDAQRDSRAAGAGNGREHGSVTDGVSATIGPKLRAFASEVLPAILGTKRSDGSVQLNPVWFEVVGNAFRINGGTGRAWLRHAKRDGGRVTLLLIDPKNMWRWAQIEGRIARTTTEGADDHIDRLSLRYLGTPYKNPKTDRITIEIAPERVTGYGPEGAWDLASVDG